MWWERERKRKVGVGRERTCFEAGPARAKKQQEWQGFLCYFEAITLG